MYATLSALTREELSAAIAMRRARPVGSCARAQARAREELAKMQLKGWPDIAMANLRAIIRAGGTQIDTLSMATLMTCTEELVIGLMAYGKISDDDFNTLAEPLAHVALPWVAELRKDQASYERIKVELEEALTITPEPVTPAFAARSVNTGVKVGRAPRQPRDATKPLKIGGIDVEKLRIKLEGTEDADMAAFMRQMREGAEPVVTAPAEPTSTQPAKSAERGALAAVEGAPDCLCGDPADDHDPSDGSCTNVKECLCFGYEATSVEPVLAVRMTMAELESAIDEATATNDQEDLERLLAELDVLLMEQQQEQEGHPETMPEVQPTPSPTEPASIPLREDDLAAAGTKPMFRLKL